jgi:4-amino-4-deoxy-L-arabinose transferase-like glycosyltransferase
MHLSQLTSKLSDAKQPAFWVPFVVFCVLLLVCPNCRPYFGDEISGIVTARGTVGETIEGAAADVHPPVYFLLLKAVRAVAGERAWALRLLSAVFASAAFPFLWVLSQRFFGKSVAIPAWLLATSSFFVFSSRFACYYSLGLLETVVATWLLLLLLERPRRGLWIAYGAVLTLSLYTFHLSIITLIAHLIVFVVAWRSDPQRLIPPLLAIAVPCLLFAPWAGAMGHQAARIGGAQEAAGFGSRAIGATTQIAYTFYAFALGDSISPFALPFSAIAGAFLAFLTVLGVRRMWRSLSKRSAVVPAMVGVALVVPAVMRLAGWMHEPAIFLPVRLLFVAPFFVMILACGILAVENRRVRYAALGAVIAIQAVAFFNYYLNRQWTNWAYAVPMAEIVANVEKRVHPDDLVILDEWNLYGGPYYYWHGKAWVYRFGPSATRWPARLQSAHRVWVVRAVRDQSPGRQTDQLLLQIKLNFVLKEQWAYVKEPAVIYEWKRRLLRREVFPHKVETLFFERPTEG